MTKSVANAENRSGPSGVFWMGFIGVLLGAQVLLMLVMVYVATTDPSFAIEPDYYQKGLNWDTTAAQTRENERLGWHVKLDVGEGQGVLGERLLVCRLVDREQRPLDGADVQLVAFPHARGSQRREVTLAASGDGGYKGSVRFEREGLWEFRIVARRGPITFTYTDVLDVFPPQTTGS